MIDDCLEIRGRKVVEREHSEGRYHFCECAYGGFERAIPLPEAVPVNRAKARYKRGVLRVELPKIEEKPTKRVRLELEGYKNCLREGYGRSEQPTAAKLFPSLYTQVSITKETGNGWQL